MPQSTHKGLLHLMCALAIISVEAEKIASVEGDINIAGLFEIQEKDGNQCGRVNIESVMLLEATRWYIEQLNKNSSIPFKIGFRGYKTCGLPSMAAEQTFEIIGRQRNCQMTEDKDDIFVGVIDALSSEEAARAATMIHSRAEENRFLQISASATASALGDRTLYSSFYRVIPDDSKQIETMVKLMKELTWNRIAIMHVDNSYSSHCAYSLKEEAQQNLICVSKMLAIHVTENGDVSIDQINALLNEIMLQSPVVGGVVLFANTVVANKVLFAVDGKGVENVPLFILSESVGLRSDVFLSSSGTVMPQTKGSMTVSVPYSEITSFTDYWLSLITNMTFLAERAASNPWLTDIFETLTGCNSAVSSCQGLTLETAKSKFHTQPVYLQYTMLSAHTMVKALYQTYKKLCSSESTVDCINDFKHDFKPHMLLEEMRNMSIDFDTDFNSEAYVEPLSSSRYHMTFGNLPGPISRSDHEIYHIYNYRRVTSGASSDEFRLLKVGSLKDDEELVLNFEAIRDYDSAGTETTFPNLRRGQCPVKQKCSECINPNIPDLFLHVPGDLYIIGIVPVNNKAIPGPQGCGAVRSRDGYQVALALQYGIEIFNSSTDFYEERTKFGDKQIGLIVLNSCYNNLTIARKILNLHESGITLANGNHLDLSNKIIGYVGGLSTWVSVSAATQLRILGHVQVSYAATYPTLSDTLRYPYFMRIVGSDRVQAEAMIEVVKAMKGEYIQIVYNECFCGIVRKDSLEEMAKKHGVCVAQYVEVKEKDSYFEYYELIRRKPHAKLVIIFLSSHILSNFMRDLNEQMPKGEFQFLGSETWGKNFDLLKYDIIKGALCVTMELEEIKGLRSYIRDKVPDRNIYDPWLEQYIQKRQDCYFDWSYDKTASRKCTEDILPPAEKHFFQIDSWCAFATNSLLALLKGSAEFFAKSCGNSALLCQEFTEKPYGLYDEMKKMLMDVTGTGPVKLFDDTGDGNLGYQVYNIQEDPDSAALTFRKVGRVSRQTGLEINTGNVVFPTDEVIVSSCPNEQVCQGCSETVPTEEEESKDSFEGGKVALGVAVGVLGLGVVVLSILFLFYARKTKAKEDPYLTPSSDLVRPEAVGKSDSPYHSADSIQETKY